MDDLLNDFIAEVRESLSKLDTEIVKLEKNPNDNDLLGSIFRIMHTIKGTCGFLSLDKLEKVAHASENVLGSIRDGKMIATSSTISVILRSIDTIKDILDYIEQNGNEPDKDFSKIISDLDDVFNGKYNEEENNLNENKLQQASLTEIKLIDTPDASETSITNNKEITETNKDKAKEDNEHKTNIDEGKQDIHDKEQKTILEQAKKIASQTANHEHKDNKNHGVVQTVRVSVDLLESLMQVVSELVLTRNQLLQIMRAEKNLQFTGPLQRLNNLTSELQEKVMKTRMQPIGNAWSQFPRLVRDLSIELHKKIELKMIGEETELDRQLIELIKDPLTHMIRNSVDHGMEKPEERVAKRKSETGLITLEAYHQGGHIIIEITDDGAGLNLKRIKDKVIANNLATTDEVEAMNDQQIYNYIFAAGLSTADKITSVSGRGVGMDVVKTNIEKISGTIDLKTNPGNGTKFIIKIPLTLAIMSVLIIECNKKKFGIPQISIIEMVKAGENSEHKLEFINDRLVLRLRDMLLPIVPLEEVLYPGNKIDIGSRKNIPIIICEIGQHLFGIIVDNIYDTEEIVVKPVSPILKSIDIYSGSTLLGDGSVIMILDPNGMFKTIGENIQGHNQDKDNSEYNNNLCSQFILFKVGGKMSAIPLDLVSRLEELPINKIEKSIGRDVIQYRDKLMYLVKINEEFCLNEEVQQVIVFSHSENTLGLMVEELIDITEASIDNIIPSQQKGYIGSLMLEGRTIEVIDIQYYYSAIFSDETIEEKSSILKKRDLEILFIDDSAFFRKFIPPMLSKAGYNIDVAEDAEIAIKMLREKNYDTIITDLNMPGLSGIDLAQHCKNESYCSKIPIIALSANISEEFMREHKNYGISGYASKTNHNELLDVLNGIMNDSEAA